MKRFLILIMITFAFQLQVFSQQASGNLPLQIPADQNYLFYLHGAVVTRLGNNAVNDAAPEWGPYEYLNILDSLAKRGFNVISENRKEGIDDSVYVNKTSKQIDTLLRAGLTPSRIIVVGASAGWDIGLRISDRIRNEKIKYVLMGGCWPESYKEFTELNLYGQFLSIIEASDPHGSCRKIFENKTLKGTVKEIVLKTGLSHGFFYKGDRHWIDPVVNWFGFPK